LRRTISVQEFCYTTKPVLQNAAENCFVMSYLFSFFIFIFIHHNGSIPDNVIYKIQYSKRKKKYNTKVEMQYNMQHAFCFQYLISFLNRENAWRLLLAGSNRQRKLLIIYDRETRMFSHLCVLLSLKLANFYLHLSA